MLNKRLIALALLLTTALVATGCGLFGGGGSRSTTLTVLAGSELEDVEPLFDQIERNTGVTLEMKYIGTLNGAEQLLAGAEYDLAWFSHGSYLTLLQGGRGLIVAQENTMLSPVVMGVKESVARNFGWVDNPDVTWADIAARSAAGDLHFAMTNPAASNSGFTSLVGVASALSGSGDALETDEINVAAMQDFFTGLTLTAGSSGWLAESYVAEQDEGNSDLDAMINYESVLLSLNEGLNDGERLREELVLIYPQEGIITADYPLMLLNEGEREAYDRLLEYIRGEDFQEDLMRETLRRPVVPGVALDRRIPDVLLVELPFPNSVDVIDSLLFSYLDEQRIPAHSFFVLDTSGSMAGDGIQRLKATMSDLTGLDDSLTGRFARFRGREQVTILPFNHELVTTRDFLIGDTDAQGDDMQEVRNFVSSLNADGGTAIYSTLAEAYQMAAQAQQAEPDRYYSIVLMSDGDNTDGIRLRGFRDFYEELPAEAQEIRTFTVLFGNANEEAMEEVSELTGGRTFDGRTESLNEIFKQIRAYQ